MSIKRLDAERKHLAKREKAMAAALAASLKACHALELDRNASGTAAGAGGGGAGAGGALAMALMVERANLANARACHGRVVSAVERSKCEREQLKKLMHFGTKIGAL